MGMSLCIYRAAKQCGACCTEETVHDTDFCRSHRRYSGKGYFSDMRVMMENENLISRANIYTCLETYWNSKQFAGVTALLKSMDILCYLLDHEKVDRIRTEMRLMRLSYAKRNTVQDIVVVNWKVWIFSKRTGAVAALTVLQRRFRERQRAVMGIYPDIQPTNTVDPFSQDDIADIPVNKLFKFQDGSGRVYAFDVYNLYSAVILYYKDENPFTKEPIPHEAVARLFSWAVKNNMRMRLPTIDEKVWRTPTTAWTEFAVAVQEHFGLYVQPEWFTHFSSYDIMNIFLRFHRSIEIPSAFMDQCEEARAFATLDDDESHYTLVREALKLVTADHRHVMQHFHQVCCLCCSMAAISFPLSRSLPDWVFDGTDM